MIKAATATNGKGLCRWLTTLAPILPGLSAHWIRTELLCFNSQAVKLVN